MEDITIGIIIGIITSGLFIMLLDWLYKTKKWKEDIENDIYEIQEDINKLFKNRNI